MDCFLISRGIKTLAVRMLRHANGLSVARHLDTHPKVERFYLPRLAVSSAADIGAAQQKGPGAMLAFDLGALDPARRFLIT